MVVIEAGNDPGTTPRPPPWQVQYLEEGVSCFPFHSSLLRSLHLCDLCICLSLCLVRAMAFQPFLSAPSAISAVIFFCQAMNIISNSFAFFAPLRSLRLSFSCGYLFVRLVLPATGRSYGAPEKISFQFDSINRPSLKGLPKGMLLFLRLYPCLCGSSLFVIPINPNLFAIFVIIFLFAWF